MYAFSTGEHSASTATATTPTTPGDHQQSSPVTAAEANLCSTVVEPSKVPTQLSESDIDSEIEELERQFSNVVSEAAEDLITVNLSQVKLCLTQLPVSVKYQFLRFLKHNRSAINYAQNVDEIFAILGEYWDFLNCGLLNEVVHQLGSDKAKQLIEQYMEKLNQFRMKTKLEDFFDEVRSIEDFPTHFTPFITEMGEDWRGRTLADLEDVRKKLAHFMHLKEYAMHFTSAQTDPIEIYWAVHSSVPVISDVLQSAFQLLEKKYCVLRVGFWGEWISVPKSVGVKCLLIATINTYICVCMYRVYMLYWGVQHQCLHYRGYYMYEVQAWH